MDKTVDNLIEKEKSEVIEEELIVSIHQLSERLFIHKRISAEDAITAAAKFHETWSDFVQQYGKKNWKKY